MSEQYSIDVVAVEDYLSDEDEIDLPLRIKMEEVPYETCLDIIRYIYTDYCEVLLENAMQLLKAANLFEIHRLKDICERKISSSITIENVAQVYVQANLANAHNLIEMTSDYILEAFNAVSKTDAFLSMITSHPDLAVEILYRFSHWKNKGFKTTKKVNARGRRTGELTGTIQNNFVVDKDSKNIGKFSTSFLTRFLDII